MSTPTPTPRRIEAIVASPPERAELVVQLFVKDGGQWGEVFREDDEFWIELYLSQSTPLRFSLGEFLKVMELAKQELLDRIK